MSKKMKRKRISMTETAELEANRVIMHKKEIQYNHGQTDRHTSKVTPSMGLYRQCKRFFALEKVGDWNSAVYIMTDEGWLDAEFNKHWILD